MTLLKNKLLFFFVNRKESGKKKKKTKTDGPALGSPIRTRGATLHMSLILIWFFFSSSSPLLSFFSLASLFCSEREANWATAVEYSIYKYIAREPHRSWDVDLSLGTGRDPRKSPGSGFWGSPARAIEKQHVEKKSFFFFTFWLCLIETRSTRMLLVILPKQTSSFFLFAITMRHTHTHTQRVNVGSRLYISTGRAQISQLNYCRSNGFCFVRLGKTVYLWRAPELNHDCAPTRASGQMWCCCCLLLSPSPPSPPPFGTALSK